MNLRKGYLLTILIKLSVVMILPSIIPYPVVVGLGLGTHLQAKGT